MILAIIHVPVNPTFVWAYHRHSLRLVPQFESPWETQSAKEAREILAANQSRAEMEEMTPSDYCKNSKQASTTFGPSLSAESVYVLSLSLTPSNAATLFATVALFAGLRGTEPRNRAPIAERMSFVRPPQPIL